MLFNLILNRYVYRYICHTLPSAIIVLLMFANQAHAQVILKGDNEANYGSPKLLNYEQCDGDDLKITLLKNGLVVPDNQGYIAGQSLNGNKYILLFPTLGDDEDQATYTIFSAISKDKKTFTHIHVITFKKPKPIPKPNPTPNPIPPAPVDPLQTKLLNAYNAAPNQAQLATIITIIEEVRKGIKDTGNDDYKTFEDIQTTFKNTANKYLKYSDLRAVRDVLGDYQVEKWGVDPRRYDHNSAKTVMDDLINHLKAIK